MERVDFENLKCGNEYFAVLQTGVVMYLTYYGDEGAEFLCPMSVEVYTQDEVAICFTVPT